LSTLAVLLSGYMIACYLVIGLFFFRFWRQAKDRLFGFFAAGFILLAVQRGLLTTIGDSDQLRLLIYALRALAFLIIIYAIIDKNRKH
jgi:hypothetical protein